MPSSACYSPPPHPISFPTRRSSDLASENISSPEVLTALGSTLSNKYAEGYPGRRYYGGCSEVDKAEELAIERCATLLGADHANVQARSEEHTSELQSRGHLVCRLLLATPPLHILSLSLHDALPISPARTSPRPRSSPRSARR